MKLPEIDFSDLDIKKIGSWPFVLRVAVIAAACVVAFVLGYYAIIKGNIAKIEEQNKQNIDKRKDFKEKFNMAANLDAYEKQMIEIKETYKRMLKQLPTSDQLAELIENISRLAENNRLKYQSIKPGEAKSVLGFYKELPLDLVLTGSYNGFGGFVSDIAKIPRIVTMHDFSIKRGAAKDQSKDTPADKSGSLSMTIQLKTYWLSSEPNPSKDGKAKDAAPPAVDKSKSPKPAAPGAKGNAPAANKLPARPGLPGADAANTEADKGPSIAPGTPAAGGIEVVE